MKSAKKIGTSMSPTCRLDKDENGKSIKKKLYRGMIGSLLYLTASRPDKLFSIYLYTRFQSNPKKSHILAVKRILWYLMGTQNLGYDILSKS